MNKAIGNYKTIAGSVPDRKDRRDFRIAGITEQKEVPEEFVLEFGFEKDRQGHVPSCTGYAAAGHKQAHEGTELSGAYNFVMGKTLPGSWGGWGQYTRIAAKSLCVHGTCERKLFNPDIASEETLFASRIPQEAIGNALAHRSKSYWRVDDHEQALLNCEVPLISSIYWFPCYNRPDANGVVRAPLAGEKTKIGHCQAEIGWCKKYGKRHAVFVDSLGLTESGLIYIPYEGLRRSDIWLTSDMPESYPVDDRYGFERTWQSFLGEQKAAFNPWLVRRIGRLPSPREICGLRYGHWDYEAVFEGRAGDAWLYKTKMEARL